MSSSESSDASRSASPETTAVEPRVQPKLDHLVEYFVSAKRALIISQQVGEEATQRLVQARTTIEDLAVRSARNVYVRSKVERQVEILSAIEQSVTASADEVDEVFQSVLARLDKAHDRLQATIAELKAVVIDSTLQRQYGQLDGQEQRQKRLFDYVDEAQYHQLSEELKTFIDSFHASHNSLKAHVDSLTSGVGRVSILINETDRNSSPSLKQTLYDQPPSTIADAFYTMEDHTRELGNLLQSLLAHYDLCVSALKHTEGGREAARDAVLGSQIKASNEELLQESLYNSKAAASLTSEERSEILRVIEGDAIEVEDVVNDIREHAAELEQYHKHLMSRAELATSDSTRLLEAVKSLRALRDDLPTYLSSAEDFKSSWNEIQASIDLKTQELDGLTSFYEAFVVGYANLLREVERRKAVEMQMQKIAEKAQRELDRLHETDRITREDFVQEFGSFLPGDLWPGVTESGVRWHIRAELPGL